MGQGLDGYGGDDCYFIPKLYQHVYVVCTWVLVVHNKFPYGVIFLYWVDLANSAGITEGFSMCGGDFVEVYSDASQEGTETTFFLHGVGLVIAKTL